MLKFLNTRDEVVELVHTLSECPELKPFKLGVAGSYVTGLNKKASPIDIVLKLREGEDSNMVGSLAINAFIHSHMEDVYSNKIKIYWLDLLEDDEESLMNFVISNGIDVNPESVYTNIVGEIRWVDDPQEDGEDRISSTVVTYDEEDEE